MIVTLSLRRRFLTGAASAAITFATACSQVIGLPNASLGDGVSPAAKPGSSGSYKTLYTFHESDGQFPMSTLLNVKGTFYGTTNVGGYSNGGTLFSITPSGKEETLHDFGMQRNDGTLPDTTLIDLNGTLYGTTSAGGKYGGGVVFSMTTSGKETVLHAFGAKRDGKLPNALTEWNSLLFGTTISGGKYGYGTAFSLTLDGSETILHDFGTPIQDGAGPGPLLEVNGTFYGVTSGGGKCYQHGTVFSMTTTGTLTSLYSFDCDYNDGQGPAGNLVLVRGKLYGITRQGGESSGSGSGCDGTVFSVTLTGKEALIHSFCSYQDGKLPLAPPIDVNGTLYGTTNIGGTNNAGAIYSVTLKGSENVLHSFGSGGGPAKPVGGLTYYKNTFYGTTVQGGHKHGVGTVFSFVP